MKKIVLTIIITLIVQVALIVAYVYSGSYDVSQLTPHGSVARWVIGKTMLHSINKRVKDINVPPLNDTSMFVQGFRHYDEMCVICHGAPGINPEELAEGLYPAPPKFYKSDDMPEPAESFWIIKFGIKMTGMPAFAPTHTDEEIWEINDFFLNKMNKMTPEEYSVWKEKYSE